VPTANTDLSANEYESHGESEVSVRLSRDSKRGVLRPPWSRRSEPCIGSELVNTDAGGWIELSDAPGMDDEPDEGRLLATRIG
jgi:hypothetical protein